MGININPDKFIRKSVHDLINGIVVSGKQIFSYDSRLSGNSTLKEYVLLSSQTKEVDKATKCAYRWETSLLIEIFTKTSSAGNSGSRLLLNDIEQAMLDLLNPKITVQGFENLTQNITFEANLETITDTEIIFRSLMRLNLTLI
jgi:hypothetical protein